MWWALFITASVVVIASLAVVLVVFMDDLEFDAETCD